MFGTTCTAAFPTTSSAQASRSPGGSERRAPYSAREGHYTVFVVPVGLFQMGDCRLIRFFKMLKKLEILPKFVDCGGRNVSSSARDKNIHLKPFRAVGRRSDSDWSRENAVDRRGGRGSQEACSSRKKRKPHLRGARRRIPKRRHRQGKPDWNQTERRRRRLRAREGPTPRASAQMGGRADLSPPRRRATLRRRRRSRSPGLAGGRRGGGKKLWRSRDRRDAAAAVGGHS